MADKPDLSYEVIDAKPVPFDFSVGYGTTWEIPLPLTQTEIREERYVPIYNFLYPLGERFSVPRDFRRRLVNTTVVEKDDARYLALTSCGMDMTWEICESYLNLGYFPPAHFARLPGMADRGKSLRDYRIALGCAYSLEALAERYSRDLRWVRETYLQ